MILDTDKELYAQEAAANTATNNGGSGFLSGLGDLLKTAGATAIDVIGAKAKAGITSTDPNINPAALNAKTLANQQQANLQGTNYTPWLIGGGIALGAIVILAVLSRRS